MKKQTAGRDRLGDLVPMIAEIWGDEETTPKLAFPIGEPNTGFAQYFIGQSYLMPLTMEQMPFIVG